MTIQPQDYQGMSDDAVADERKAQDLVNMAKKILIEASRHSTLMGITILDGLDALPNMAAWDEEIQERRQIG